MKRLAPLLTMAMLLPAGTVALGARTSPVVPASQRVAGRSYTQWMVASWQWVLAHGHSQVTKTPHPLSCFTQGQRGPVWFLQDEYEEDAPATVSCEVPARHYLFLEGPAFDCSTAEAPPFHGTPNELARCARKFTLVGAQVTLDGRTLHPSSFLITTPVFPFAMPPTGNVLNVAGKTRGYAAVRGYALMLRPLAPGRHTIVQVERFANGVAVQITWQLRVR